MLNFLFKKRSNNDENKCEKLNEIYIKEGASLKSLKITKIIDKFLSINE